MDAIADAFIDQSVTQFTEHIDDKTRCGTVVLSIWYGHRNSTHRKARSGHL